MNTLAHRGFRIHYFRDLANPGTHDLRVVRINTGVPLVDHAVCPCCSSFLVPLYVLVSGDGRKHVRRGFCEQCGYIGYLNMPSRAWLSSFYGEEWDNAQLRHMEQEISFSQYQSLPHLQKGVVERVHTLPLDRAKTVCDIGCGKGFVLRAFAEEGFTRLVGVESSRYRSEFVKRKFGWSVYTGDFESLGDALEKEKPIGLFFCFHVLEHVFDPAQFLACAARLQNPGDFLVLSVPNGAREPWLNRLLWLPHLHSFAEISLMYLFENAGYDIFDEDTQYPHQLTFIARKKETRKIFSPPIFGEENRGENEKSGQRSFPYGTMKDRAVDDALLLPKTFPSRNHIVQQFQEEMRLLSMHHTGRFRMQWRTKAWYPELVSASSFRLIDRIRQRGEQVSNFIASRFFQKFTNRRSCIVSKLANRYTDPREFPIEIQYDGDIELLVR